MKRFLVALSVVAVLGLCAQTYGSEGGGCAYPNGAEGFMAGAVPPPGDYLLDYVLFYSADELKADDPSRLPPSFDLNVVVNVIRYLHVTPVEILGGLWAQHIFVPFGNEDVDLGVAGSDDDTGLGDIIVDPFILSWHSKNWHAVCGVDIYVPVGGFDENEMANMSRGYWTIEPVVAGTYITDGGYEASAKVMYDFNIENPDTDYLTGQELHMDWTLAKRTAEWAIGVGGYAYTQVTDDESNGTTVDDNKGQVLAAGPQVSYQHKNMTFIAKYQQEFEVENRPEGQAAWLKLIVGL